MRKANVRAQNLQTRSNHGPNRNLGAHEHLADIPLPRIPPGKHEAICYKIETGVGQGGRETYYLKFRVHGGEYHDTELFMTCPKPSGKVRFRHKLYDQWVIANQRLPTRREKISVKPFVGRLYLVLVRDTRRRYANSNELKPNYAQYSVIDSIIEPLTGGHTE